MTILLLNLVGLVFPALLIAIMFSNNNTKMLIFSASGLFGLVCLKKYAFINGLQFDYVGAFMVAAFAALSAINSKNKLLKRKKIPALYPDQTTHKILPMKYHLCELLYVYFIALAIFTGGAVMFIYIFGLIDGMNNNMHQIVENPQSHISQISIMSGVNNYIALIYFILASISGLLSYGLNKAKNNMLPVFWRLQLAPIFNPKHKNVKSIEEITDKDYLKKIFEVNKVILIENNFVERQASWNDALSHIKTNYPLVVDEIITRPYLAGTMISGQYEDGEYKLYFIKLQRTDDDKTPPTEIKKDEVKTEKLNEGVAANAI